MSIVKGMSALLFATVLAMPMAATADRDRDRDRDGYDGDYGEECQDRRGNGRCKGGNGRGNGHRGRGGDHHAGGPPPWAPAHGWRRKHGGGYDRDYAEYDDDYYVDERSGARVHVSNGAASIDVGIRDGHCNREQIGTVVGGLIGGAIGNRVGGSDNREVATVLGVVVGGVLGNRIGHSMDNNDRHCTGQTLEQAPDHQTVRWADGRGDGEYRVTPQRTYEEGGRYCRDYITEYDGRNGVEREESSACRNEDGSWQKRRM